MRGIAVAGAIALVAATPGEAAPATGATTVLPRIDPVATSGVPLTSTLRLEVTMVRPLAAAPALDLQQRFDSAMLDYFPADGDGFHVSAGLRLFARHNFLRESARNLDVLLFAPRGTGGNFGGRRFVPVVMGGFSHRLGSNMMIGADAGAMTGRLYSAPGPTPGSTQRLADSGSINPVARLAFSLRF